MQEKMYHLWKEYKDSIDGLSTRYYAAMSSLKDIPEKNTRRSDQGTGAPYFSTVGT